MNRAIAALDRTVGLVLGLLLVAAGVLGLMWSADVGPWQWSDQIETDPVTEVAATAWWPWALAVAGVLLTLLGLRWLFGHVPHDRVGFLHLSPAAPAAEGEESGTLTVDASSLAGAAADALAADPAVESASGRAIREHGQVIIELTATLQRDAELTGVAARADQVCATVSDMVGRSDLACRVQLRPARGRTRAPRVV